MQTKDLQIAAPFAPALDDFSHPLVQTPPIPQCEVCVVIPVRNEASMLTTTLSALANQVDLNHQPLNRDRYEIIVFANNCTDDSTAIAHQFAQQHPDLRLHVVERTLPLQEAHIGRVRQMLMNEAHRRLDRLGRKRGIIASTDGDSRVSCTWIAAILQEIAWGADAVGGRILLDPVGLARLASYARLCHLREVGYRSLVAELESYLDPDPYDRAPRHFQHYGASFAVTAEIYNRAGGLPLVRTPEDVALYQALRRVNARFRHSPAVRVMTSARQIGRTDLGLANQLSVWAAMGKQQQPFWVESGAEIEARFRSCHQLRLFWERSLSGDQCSMSEIASIANSFGISTGWLHQALMQPQTFGLLFEQVEHRQQQEGNGQGELLVPIEQAIQELRIRLQRIKSSRF
jgi:hypothetical protein